MNLTTPESYRSHPVWEVLKLKINALEQAKFQNIENETQRCNVVLGLKSALRSKSYSGSIDYGSILSELLVTLNSLASDDQTFASFARSNQIQNLWTYIRQLPGPSQIKVNENYSDALDLLISARTVELSAINERITAAQQTMAEVELKIGTQKEALELVKNQIISQSAKLSETVETASDKMDGEWKNKLESWAIDRTTKDKDLENEMLNELSLLVSAALVGNRLMENAAGNLTAIKWASRATRERTSAIRLRYGSFVVYSIAVLIGTWIVTTAISAGKTLDAGDGIIRGAIVLSCAAIGTFLASESRRHFREADSSEEVQLAITAMEPFMTNATEEDRQSTRAAMADTVFVKNVLSRFSGRDASRHNSSNSVEMSELVEVLRKALTLGNQNSSGPLK